ncbi:MAG: hypothetical protein AAFY76_26320, partial [Cyanobacteria bacterium J06649_11]
MVERPTDGKLGFAPSLSEEKDYFECLQLFRQAQEYELESNNTKANDCYERSLSYRYFYPDLSGDIGSNVPVISSISTASESIKKNLTKSAEDIVPYSSKYFNPFSIFSLEIWYQIICYLQNDKSLRSLCQVFPDLRPEMKRAIFGKINPIVDHHSGIFTKFSFKNGRFVNSNLEQCIKTSAVYSMFLLGNTPSDTHYMVSYDKKTREAKTVEMNDLIYGVFAEEPVYGTILKVRQHDDLKDPIKDLYHSVDRQFMAEHLGREDIGIDLQSELRSKLTIAPSSNDENDSEYVDDVFNFDPEFWNLYSKRPYPERDVRNRSFLEGFDSFYESVL